MATKDRKLKAAAVANGGKVKVPELATEAATGS
jgi:hypothetical protein